MTSIKKKRQLINEKKIRQLIKKTSINKNNKKNVN